MSKLSKPKSKLFRPYDLDSPNSTAHQTLPPSPTAPKKFSPPSSNTSIFLNDLQTTASSGKEKQLFNSLGLAQQPTDSPSEKSPSVTISDDSASIEITAAQQDDGVEKSPSNRKPPSSPNKLKRKSNPASKKSSNRKQSKIDATVE